MTNANNPEKINELLISNWNPFATVKNIARTLYNYFKDNQEYCIEYC